MKSERDFIMFCAWESGRPEFDMLARVFGLSERRAFAIIKAENKRISAEFERNHESIRRMAAEFGAMQRPQGNA